MNKKRYLTTAIPYVNAAPHIGFALEIIQADCLARQYRLQGYNVRLQAGADENSLKNVQAADAAGVPVEKFVRDHADRFYGLKTALGLSFDHFIRTSSDDGHRIGVSRLWTACAKNGDIYKRQYSGLYCQGCEQFYKPADLQDGRCPEHDTEPEEISEENYFFRLSRYEERLREAITSGEMDIVPASRKNEVLAWIDSGLEDFSISRSAERARGWGIPVPGDPGQVIYVWFDALGNYITALGYSTDSAELAEFWTSASRREHVIGKGISRFHAIYWPAMLLSAGLALPTRIFVHGYVTVEGQKIGKSMGNAIDPVPLAELLGEDALRYYLLRHIRSTEDGDFNRERFLQAYESELAGQLGNLAHRTFSMIERYCEGVIPSSDFQSSNSIELMQAGDALPQTVAKHIEEFQFHDALTAIWAFIAQSNKYVTVVEPWSLAKKLENGADCEASAELEDCLYTLAYSLGIIGYCLAPFLPTTSTKLLTQLGIDGSQGRPRKMIEVAGLKLNPGEVLFPKAD